jgi:hypothetical protein
LPEPHARQIIGQYVDTSKEYTQELINMRGGDIFMGAFNAEQVMYNHFGYRTPIPNLYMAARPAIPAAPSPAEPDTSRPASSPAISARNYGGSRPTPPRRSARSRARHSKAV